MRAQRNCCAYSSTDIERNFVTLSVKTLSFTDVLCNKYTPAADSILAFGVTQVVGMQNCMYFCKVKASAHTTHKSSFRHIACLQSERRPSRLPAPASERVCRWMWPLLRHCLHLDNTRGQFCSAAASGKYMSPNFLFFLLTVVLAVFLIHRPLLKLY